MFRAKSLCHVFVILNCMVLMLRAKSFSLFAALSRSLSFSHARQKLSDLATVRDSSVSLQVKPA